MKITLDLSEVDMRAIVFSNEYVFIDDSEDYAAKIARHTYGGKQIEKLLRAIRREMERPRHG